MGRKIVIVGAGAVGGYAGAHMVQAGEDVTFIDPWPEHVEHMRKHGLRVTHAKDVAEFTVPVRALHVTDAQQLSKEKPVDIAFICMKSYDTAWATMMIRQYLAPDGYAVSLQNCMNEETIAGIVGWGRTLGTIASLITGAWMPANLIGSAPKASGDFRVAATPVPTAGSTANSENGGSSLAVLASSQKQAAAYKFLQFTSDGDGVAIRLKGGNFPSTTADLASADFLGHTDKYFGGQEYNKVLAQAAKDVLPGWSYLPFQVYANSIFGDKVKDVYAGKGTLKDAYAAWQTDLEKYGKENGFIK